MGLAGKLAIVVVPAIAWLAYGSFSGQELLHWDDIAYLSANPHGARIDMASLQWMLLGSAMENWHPLTWLSYALNQSLGADSAQALKHTNLALHCVAALVLGMLTHRALVVAGANKAEPRSPALPGIAAVLAALLFVVHPQHVESVAWVAERKDVLCGLFFLLAMYFYLGSSGDTLRPNGVVLFCAILALMSKSMAVSLPLALVALDLFPLRSVRRKTWVADLGRSVREKWVLLLISLGVGLITLTTQSPQPIEHAGLADRGVVAVHGMGFYWTQFLLAPGFVPFHPYDHFTRVHPALFIAGFVPPLILLAAAAWPGRCSGFRLAAISGCLFYLATLLPVIGIVKVGEQAFADRYAYIPTAPLYVAAGWLLAGLWTRTRSMPGRVVAGAVPLMLVMHLVIQTRAILPTWANDESLWRTVTGVYDGIAATPHINLGNALHQQGRYGPAIEQYQKALEIDPDRLLTHYNLAFTLARSGRHAEAQAMINRILNAFPDNPVAWSWCGDLAFGYGDLAAAERFYTEALRLAPRLDQALSGLARVYFRAGDAARGRSLLNRIPRGSPYFDAARDAQPVTP